jgi:hypothetical protein
LRRIVALDLEIARLRLVRDRFADAMYRKLKTGARVAAGAHTCSLEVYRQGGVRGERLRVR